MYHAMVVHQYVSSDRRMLDIFPGEVGGPLWSVPVQRMTLLLPFFFSTDEKVRNAGTDSKMCVCLCVFGRGERGCVRFYSNEGALLSCVGQFILWFLVFCVHTHTWMIVSTPQKLIVLGQEDGWLYSSNDKGESGFVPPAFVSFLDWSPPDTSTTGSWQQP